MNSNIEPLAREMAARICRREGMPEPEGARWGDLHWPCAAAMLEGGRMDEAGPMLGGRGARTGVEGHPRGARKPAKIGVWRVRANLSKDGLRHAAARERLKNACGSVLSRP